MTVRRFLPPLLAALIGFGAFLGFALAGWRGAPNTCIAADTCFCEAFHDGPVRQPSNTWSALAFAAAGLLIAALAGKRGSPSFRPGLYSCLVVLIGVGTAFFHGSMTWWGGTLDYLSMYLLLSYVFALGILRWGRLPRPALLPLFLLGFLPPAAVNLSDLADTPPVFACLVAAAFAAETAAALSRRDLVREGRWMTATLALFGTGFLIWMKSRTHQAWCLPDSLVQGHAVWHFFCAAATVTLALYYLSERELEAA